MSRPPVTSSARPNPRTRQRPVLRRRQVQTCTRTTPPSTTAQTVSASPTTPTSSAKGLPILTSIAHHPCLTHSPPSTLPPRPPTTRYSARLYLKRKRAAGALDVEYDDDSVHVLELPDLDPHRSRLHTQAKSPTQVQSRSQPTSVVVVKKQRTGNGSSRSPGICMTANGVSLPPIPLSPTPKSKSIPLSKRITRSTIRTRAMDTDSDESDDTLVSISETEDGLDPSFSIPAPAASLPRPQKPDLQQAQVPPSSSSDFRIKSASTFPFIPLFTSPALRSPVPHILVSPPSPPSSSNSDSTMAEALSDSSRTLPPSNPPIVTLTPPSSLLTHVIHPSISSPAAPDLPDDPVHDLPLAQFVRNLLDRLQLGQIIQKRQDIQKNWRSEERSVVSRLLKGKEKERETPYFVENEMVTVKSRRVHKYSPRSPSCLRYECFAYPAGEEDGIMRKGPFAQCDAQPQQICQRRQGELSLWKYATLSRVEQACSTYGANVIRALVAAQADTYTSVNSNSSFESLGPVASHDRTGFEYLPVLTPATFGEDQDLEDAEEDEEEEEDEEAMDVDVNDIEMQLDFSSSTTAAVSMTSMAIPSSSSPQVEAEDQYPFSSSPSSVSPTLLPQNSPLHAQPQFQTLHHIPSLSHFTVPLLRELYHPVRWLGTPPGKDRLDTWIRVACGECAIPRTTSGTLGLAATNAVSLHQQHSASSHLDVVPMTMSIEAVPMAPVCLSQSSTVSLSMQPMGSIQMAEFEMMNVQEVQPVSVPVPSMQPMQMTIPLSVSGLGAYTVDPFVPSIGVGVNVGYGGLGLSSALTGSVATAMVGVGGVFGV